MRCWPAKAQASEPRSPERIPLQLLQRPGQGGQIGRTDRELRQSPKRKNRQGTNGCSGMPRAEVTPPNCQAAHCGRGPKARGRGGPGGEGERESPEPEIGEGAGGDDSARQHKEWCSPLCAPTLGTEARAGPGGRARAKGGPSIRTGATARRPSPVPQALP